MHWSRTNKWCAHAEIRGVDELNPRFYEGPFHFSIASLSASRGHKLLGFKR